MSGGQGLTPRRQIILLVPLAWLLHFAGLNYVWLTFPVTEVIAMCCCLFLARRGETHRICPQPEP